MGITNTGYQITTEEEYYNIILNELKLNFPTLNENYANAIIVLARVVARNEFRRDTEVADLYNQAYVSTATGLSLDKAGYIYGLPRDNGTSAIGTITITKSVGVEYFLLPAYAQLRCGELIYQCSNEDAITIYDNTYDIIIKSIEVGEKYNLPIASKFEFVSAVPNVSDVSAKTAIVGGLNMQNDAEYRNDLFEFQSQSRNSSLPSIVGQVSFIDGVDGVTGYENTNDFVTNGMLPKSISLYVSGGTDEDIVTKIVQTKAGGISTNGDVTKTVTINGKQYTGSFFRLTPLSVYYDIEVSVNSNTVPSDIVDIIKNAIIEFTNVKTTIKPYDLNGMIAQCNESINGTISTKLDIVTPPVNTGILNAAVGKYFVSDVNKINLIITPEDI